MLDSGAASALQIVTQIGFAPNLTAALDVSAYGPFEVHACRGREVLLAHLAERGCDALLLIDDDAAHEIAAEIARDVAVLVVSEGGAIDPARALDWLARGAQDLLSSTELNAAAAIGLRLRTAIHRKRLERDARTAYATDLDTGLPHQQQLIEHMSQLLALREREPAPMAVLALRVEGLATIEARLGREPANVLRRKLGVRLRAGVRSSDVVASLGDDGFAVLLGSILAPDDADRVGGKLLAVLGATFRVAGHEITIATAIGIGHFPQDGAHPEALLRRAVSLAAAAPAQGRVAFEGVSAVLLGTHARAANDE